MECGDNESDNRFDGVCDKDGCDYNHWRQGDKTYFGSSPDFQVDTTRPMVGRNITENYRILQS